MLYCPKLNKNCCMEADATAIGCDHIGLYGEVDGQLSGFCFAPDNINEKGQCTKDKKK